MSLVKIGKATGRRLRRFPAKNREKTAFVGPVGKFAEAKCSISSTSSIRKYRDKALRGTVRN